MHRAPRDSFSLGHPDLVCCQLSHWLPAEKSISAWREDCNEIIVLTRERLGKATASSTSWTEIGNQMVKNTFQVIHYLPLLHNAGVPSRSPQPGPFVFSTLASNVSPRLGRQPRGRDLPLLPLSLFFGEGTGLRPPGSLGSQPGLSCSSHEFLSSSRAKSGSRSSRFLPGQSGSSLPRSFPPAPTSTLGSDNIYNPRPGTITTLRHPFLREDVVFLDFEETQAGEVAHVPRGHTVQVSGTCLLPIHSPELDPFALFAETNFRFF